MSTRRPFVALAVAETCSLCGTRLSMIAIPWLVLTTTGSATMTGVVGMAEMLPYVLMKAMGGPIIDRVGPKHIAVALDSLSVLIVGLVPILHLLGMLHLPVLLGLVMVMGALRGPSDGAKDTLIPHVADLAGYPLERVTGVAGTIERLAGTMGAAAAGGLVALAGPANALVVDAVSFGIAALLIGRLIPVAGSGSASETCTAADETATSPEGEEVSPTGLPAYVQELREGWTFQRNDAVLMGIAVMVAITNLLDQAWAAVLVPVWAHHSGAGVGSVGLVFAALSGMSVLGSVVATWKGAQLPRMLVYTAAFITVGLPRFAVFALGCPLWIVLAVVGVGGFGSGFINPILSAVEFERIPKPLIGRVSTLQSAMAWSLIPFGGLVGGLLITAGGLPTAMIVVGLCYFVVTLMPLARKSFRGFDRRPAAQQPVSAG
ncbi:MFS transporter [Leekyejoonella antrihumi]|uniref:MFS transporter n=1 Tax=Leekyejoonella antrihumi TaxID=1660198 RepID=A0A563DYD4_9MICO|nr:MFS transporter [Leekyejoonella antrihumi]TWP35278.1 MFS transporter [Leekyejoonella antrihumi]